MSTLSRFARSAFIAGTLLATVTTAAGLAGPVAADEGRDRFAGLSSDRGRDGEVVLANFSPAGLPLKGDFTAEPPGSSAGPVGPLDKKAGPGCSVQCITSGVALARGPGAELRVKTDTPARIFILVYNDDYGRILDSGNGSLVTQFDAHFDDLDAGQQYQAVVHAVDAQGYKSEASGHFDTLNRHVKVEFSSAQISAHAYDESRFRKMVWAEGEFIENLTMHGLHMQGSFLYWNDDVVQLHNVGRYLDFAVQLVENDNDANLCEAVSLDEPDLGAGDCSTWAYATFGEGEGDLDERPADATSWTEHTIKAVLHHPSVAYGLPPGWGQPLTFYVDVTLHVTYD